MRAAVLIAALLGACSVSAKHAIEADAGLEPASPDAPLADRTPDTTITSSPAEFSSVAVAAFTFTSDDATATFACSVDGDTPVPCATPFTRSLGDGPHGFVVRAATAAGANDDTPAEHVWTIDTIAPTTTITMGPPAIDNSASVTLAFSSDEDNVAFDCAVDGDVYAGCTTGQLFEDLVDGQHTIAVRAHDRAGNLDASPAIRAWVLDSSTPDTQLLSGPSGPTSSTTAAFTFLSPDAGAGATFQCRLDAAPFTPCTSPTNLINLPAGAHGFAVRVRDPAGNLDPSPAVRAWVVDLTPPETTILTGPTGMVATASATFTFAASEDGTFACSLDGAAFAACTSPVFVALLAQGAHALAVRATDLAGHLDATPATRTWIVDTAAPDVAITAGPASGATVGPRVSFAFTVSEGIVACSLDAAAFTTCASPQAWNVPVGAHQLRIQATDQAGNVTTATRAWTTACTAPTASGAVGLLHLDTGDQVQPNAVLAAASATLGADATVEPADPAFVAAARFAGGLAFASGDLVAWPLGAGATSTPSFTLYATPDRPAALVTVLATADGRLALRVVPGSGTTVKFALAVDGNVATSSQVAAGQSHHVAASLTSTTLRLWVDGDRTDVVVSALAMPLALDALQLGGTYGGVLDEVWIATTSLSSDDAALAAYCPM